MQRDAKATRTLLDKWRLIRAAARDNKRLSTGDVAVLMALCDRYGNKTDPDRPPMAGHALLAAMAGLSRRGAIDSTRRLIDAGYISVLQLGSGTRGTVYSLNFARGEPDFTTEVDEPSGEPECTTEVNHASPLAHLSGELHFTESPITVAPLHGGLPVVESVFDASPTAQLVSAPEAAPSLPAAGGFEEFWEIWPRKHGLAKARTAHAKTNPNEHVAIVDAARDWAAHFACHNIDKKWIPEPANWLSGERWLEDLPIIHGDAKGASIARAKANAVPKAVEADNDNEPYEPVNDVGPFSPWGEFEAEIAYVSVDRGWVSIDLDLVSPSLGVRHQFNLSDPRGAAFMRSILAAAGLPEDQEELDDLLFVPIRVTIDERFAIAYFPITREAAA